MNQKKPDYPYIRAWGEMMGSFQYYIEDQVARARAQNAPPTAIFEEHAKDGSGPTGEWATFEGIQRPDTKEHIAQLVKAYL